MKYDMMNQFFPCRYFISECFHNHILPLWCPYIKFGYPFYADPQAGFFYPVTWFIAATFGYNAYSINGEFIFHVVIASISFFLLLRQLHFSSSTSVVFGIIYGLSGVFIGNAQHLSWVVSMAWLPFVLLQFKLILEKPGLQHALLFAIGLYLMISGGYPAFVIILFYFLFGFLAYHVLQLFRKKEVKQIKNILLFSGISVAIALFLSAGYLYSFFSSLPYIDRGSGITIAQANSFPFSIPAMISLLFPFVTTCSSYNLFTDVSMANAYCGVLLFPLLIISWLKAPKEIFVKGFFLFGLICLLASAGELTPVRSWMYYLLPGMKMFRHAAVFRVFTVLSFLTFAAAGFDWLLMAKDADARFVLKVLLSFFLLLAVIFVTSLFFNSFFFSFPKIYSVTEIFSFNEKRNALTHLSAQCFLSLLFVGLIIALFQIKQLEKIRNIGVCVLLILEIFFSAQLNLPCTVLSNASVKDLQNNLNKLPKNFSVPESVVVNHFTHIDYGFLPVQFNTSMLRKIPAVDGYNNFQLNGMNDFTETELYHSVANHKLAFFTAINSGAEMVEDTSVIYTCTKFAPDEMRFDFDSKQDMQLVLLQSNFPGWKARCDDIELSIKKPFNLFMSVIVPQGRHIISFTFQPVIPTFLFWITSISFLISLFAALWFWFFKSCNKS
jgi:hypothetical protein